MAIIGIASGVVSKQLLSMALDPEFIKKVQERKAKREAREARYKHIEVKPGTRSGPRSKKTEPVFKSTSMLTGDSTYITGEDAKERVKEASYKGKV
jgi:hypothetical protein